MHTFEAAERVCLFKSSMLQVDFCTFVLQFCFPTGLSLQERHQKQSTSRQPDESLPLGMDFDWGTHFLRQSCWKLSLNPENPKT